MQRNAPVLLSLVLARLGMYVILSLSFSCMDFSSSEGGMDNIHMEFKSNIWNYVSVHQTQWIVTKND